MTIEPNAPEHATTGAHVEPQTDTVPAAYAPTGSQYTPDGERNLPGGEDYDARERAAEQDAAPTDDAPVQLER
jgi:hypothetical protein